MQATRNEDGSFTLTDVTAREMGTLVRAFQGLRNSGKTRDKIFTALNEAAPDVTGPEFVSRPAEV